MKIPAYGIVCTVKDPKADPRKIKSIDSEYLIRLTLMREQGLAYAIHGNQEHVSDVLKTGGESAVSDLASTPFTNGAVDRASYLAHAYKRDSKVRRFVVERANGKCEYCCKEGFLMSNGKHYIEAHHIIALAKQGPDSLDNVIGLCPVHHREAHYGLNAEDLEQEFLKILSAINR